MRQLAVVLLKQFIVSHWTCQYDKFEEPEVNAENKARIRSALISSLGQECDLSDSGPEKRLRSGIAFAVYSIAHYDWPEDWPDLMSILMAYVTSGSRSAVYASMKVFVELCHEITESQVASIAPLLLPQMLLILRDGHSYSVRTRGRAVQVFSSIVETLSILCDLERGGASSGSKFLNPVLPDFLQTLIHLLQVSQSAGSCADLDIGLRKDLLSCLTILLKHFPRKLSKSLPQILGTVWLSLTSSAVTYVNTVVNSDTSDLNGSVEQPQETVIDSDGEVLGQEAFIFSLFEFMGVLIESAKTRKLMKAGMTDLIYFLLMFVQVTDEQVQVWSMNPDQFVEDEDEDSFSFSVRLSAQDVLLSLATEFEESEDSAANEGFRSAFMQAVKRHLSESNQVKQQADLGANNNNSHNNWWKMQESCLFALGSLSESLVEVIQSNAPLASEVKSVLDSVLSTDFLNTGCPFFSGRCLWTAARFTPIMAPDVIARFLHLTVLSFSHPSPVIKISATRATYSFSCHLRDSGQQAVMQPFLSAMLDGLLGIGIQFSAEVLALVLETLCLMASLDPEFTAANEARISPLAIATFLRNSSDPVLISCCQNVFKELSKNPGCTAALQSRLGPTLNSILCPTGTAGSETATVLQPAALDILTSMARASPTPFSDMMMQLFASAVSCILRTSEDNACLQNGGECIRAFVSRSTEQVMTCRFGPVASDGERAGGVHMVMQVCMHLLDPRVGESCCAFVGRLVSISIGKAASLLGPDNVHLLLRSVLSKMQTAETLSVIQSLVMVFAHLIHYEMQTVLDFLSSIPGPSGSQSALHFLLNLWLSRQHLFFGSYEKKVSILALGKLLQHSVVNASAGASNLNLNLIQVPGDPIDSPDTGIRTRSKSKAVVEQWTQVPCSVKILKILLAEVQNLEELKDTNSQDGDEDDEDEDAESIDEQDGLPAAKNRLSSLCADHGDDCADEEDLYDDEDEEDVDEDELTEIKEMNLTTYLSNFMRDFKQTTCSSEFLSQLNDNERNLIHSMN